MPAFMSSRVQVPAARGVRVASVKIAARPSRVPAVKTQAIFGNLFGKKEEPMKTISPSMKGKAKPQAPAKSSAKATTTDKEYYACNACGYIYTGNIAKAARDYKCPTCNAGKAAFKPFTGNPTARLFIQKIQGV